MKMRNILLTVMSTTLLIFASCTKKQDTNERVLNLVSITEIKGYDPIMANDLYSGREISKIYEGLLNYHWLKVPYELQPNLAEAMPEASKDGLTYTFKIRPGIKFQDDIAFPEGKGREVLASDFVYSIKRLADSKNQAEGWWVLDGKLKGLNEWRDKNAKLPAANYDEEVEGVKATDKYTIQFKLKKVFPQFLYGLAMPYTYVVAKEAVDKYGKEFINHPVGTGPYVLPKFDQGKRIIYTKNPTFREKFYPSDSSPELKHLLADAGKRLPLVDKIIVNVMIESQPAWLKLNKGEIDTYSIPKDNFATAVKDNKLSPELINKGLALSITPMLDLTYTAFNYDNKLFQNTKLRKAMYMAFDEAKSNELFYNNTAFPAQSVIPPGIAGNIKGYINPFKGPNLEGAKKMLAEAGYPDGKGLPEITYDIADSTTSRQMAEFFQKQMEQIGIKIKVQASPWPEFLAKQKKRSLQMFGAAWGADYPDAENFLQLLYGPNASPGANSSNYNNPQFNKDFEAAVAMQDSPERTARYEKLNKFLAEDVVVMFNNHRQSYSLTQGWLRNYHYSDLNLDYVQYLNLDTAKKAELLKKF
ncbi:MAG: ABC transporter substrate-binding protein [Bacteriovorax sp.]|nr:ABC transporter substrate-binding protein [Bacteriovorax sp.]